MLDENIEIRGVALKEVLNGIFSSKMRIIRSSLEYSLYTL